MNAVELFVLGIVVALCVLVLFLFNALFHMWFKWINDGEEAYYCHWWPHFLMTKVRGYTLKDTHWSEYAKGEKRTIGSNVNMYGLTLLVALVSPAIAYLCYLQPLIPIVLVTFIAVSFALRGVKRLIKELKAHKQDKDAHK